MRSPKKQKPEDTFTPRARGCLWGLAVGDALGGPLSGRRLAAPPFPELAEPLFMEPRGGGVFKLAPGQVTAGTQMAVILSTSLRETETLDLAVLRRQYQEWLPHAVGVSAHTLAVLQFTPAHEASRAVWHQSGRRSAGGEPLVRGVPLAVFHAQKTPEELCLASFELCALTHLDPRCQLASAVLNQALVTAMTTPDATPESIIESAKTALNVAAPELTKLYPELVRETLMAVEALRLDLAAARADDPELYGPELHLHAAEDSVRVTFRLAFWELMHATSLEAALVDATHRGGQAQTHGAITGALFGALDGEAAVPLALKSQVQRALERDRGPLRSKYHPEKLLFARKAEDVDN